MWHVLVVAMLGMAPKAERNAPRAVADAVALDDRTATRAPEMDGRLS
jgi:hypothetical protein